VFVVIFIDYSLLYFSISNILFFILFYLYYKYAQTVLLKLDKLRTF